MRIAYQIPTFFQHLYPGVVWRMNKREHAVYITFDDGCIPEVTPEVLRLLKKYNAKATFFIVGENAVRYPELLRQVRDEGHSVGNHTFNHLKGFKLSCEAYLKNIEKADKVLHTRLFRPPYGRMTGKEKRAILAAGYTIYLWDVLTHDYSTAYPAERIVPIVKRYTRNGSIINFHDSLKSKAQTLSSLEGVLQWLQEQGYEMRAISEPNKNEEETRA